MHRRRFSVSCCCFDDQKAADADLTNKEKLDTLAEGTSIGGLLKAYQKFHEILKPKPEAQAVEKKPDVEDVSFATLLRQSKLMQLGDPRGKIVTGTVERVIGEDLYIDFGWKFQCVCKRPAIGGNAYQIGTKVRVMIRSLELSTRFLGATSDLTLLEADCQLLGLLQSGDLSETKERLPSPPEESVSALEKIAAE